jgi:hypothetical protein
VTASAQVIACFVSYDEILARSGSDANRPASQPGSLARLDTYQGSRRAPGRGGSARWPGARRACPAGRTGGRPASRSDAYPAGRTASQPQAVQYRACGWLASSVAEIGSRHCSHRPYWPWLIRSSAASISTSA